MVFSILSILYLTRNVMFELDIVSSNLILLYIYIYICMSPYIVVYCTQTVQCSFDLNLFGPQWSLDMKTFGSKFKWLDY